jgi:hypothetical protein
VIVEEVLKALTLFNKCYYPYPSPRLFARSTCCLTFADGKHATLLHLLPTLRPNLFVSRH